MSVGISTMHMCASVRDIPPLHPMDSCFLNIYSEFKEILSNSNCQGDTEHRQVIQSDQGLLLVNEL